MAAAEILSAAGQVQLSNPPAARAFIHHQGTNEPPAHPAPRQRSGHNSDGVIHGFAGVFAGVMQSNRAGIVASVGINTDTGQCFRRVGICPSQGAIKGAEIRFQLSQCHELSRRESQTTLDSPLGNAAKAAAVAAHARIIRKVFPKSSTLHARLVCRSGIWPEPSRACILTKSTKRIFGKSKKA